MGATSSKAAKKAKGLRIPPFHEWFSAIGGNRTLGNEEDAERNLMLKSYGVLMVFLARPGLNNDEMDEFPMINGADYMNSEEIERWWKDLVRWYNGLDEGEVLALQPEIIDAR